MRSARALGLATLMGVAAGCAGPAALPVPEGPPPAEPEPVEAGQAAPPGTYGQAVDVRAYDLEVAVSDTARWIQGRARLEVRVTGPLAEPLGLDFVGLAIDRVTVDGEVVTARHEAGRLYVPLPEGAAAAQVEVLYRGVPDDGLILGENVHGDPSAFVDNWPNRARFWFPSVDHPSDKATVELTIHAPGTWNVIANGVLVDSTGTPPTGFGPAASVPRRTWRWDHDVPISTYNMVFGGADMRVDRVGLAACGSAPASRRRDGCVEVTTWLFPESAEAGAASFRRADAMVDHFTELVGPFPYAKLANVQSSTRFGGMENATAIFYSERAIAEGRDIEGTVSHEIAHQWFGDSVTEADWRHLWLSEGFATYFGNQFFEAADGPSVFRLRMNNARSAYLRSDVTGRPIVDPEVDDLFELLNANNYQKGAWVLHMLRGVLGDEVFFRGIREYYRRFVNGTALTSDLQEVMEQVSGEELGWFFEQWVFEPGYPVLRTETRGPGEGGGVTFRIQQVQDPDWPTFRIPLTLEIEAGGEVTRHEVLVDQRSEYFELDLPALPDRISVDPDGWVLGILDQGR